MRPIDADALKDFINRQLAMTANTAVVMNAKDFFENIVDNAPTIDAVPVVRCKDCKWKVVTKFKENYCLRCEDIVKDDYFCADGAKMDVSDNDVGERSEE